jgi:5-methylcytosine-specific restriction protein B
MTTITEKELKDIIKQITNEEYIKFDDISNLKYEEFNMSYTIDKGKNLKQLTFKNDYSQNNSFYLNINYYTNNRKLKCSIDKAKFDFEDITVSLNDEDYLTPIVKALNNNIKIIKTEELKNNLLKIKNIMLYGAPGVGKTYNYKRLISMIENGDDEKIIFDTISQNATTNDFDNSTFETIKKEKRIEFVTFHQSYSYEDFIEGFRPQDNGNIKLEDGIFKKLCSDSEINFLKSSNNKAMLFIDTIGLLLKDKIENQENVKINLKRNNSYYNIYDYNDKTIYFEKQNGDKSHSLSMKTLEKMYYEESNTIINGGLAPYYNPLLEELLKLKKKENVQKEEQKNFYIVIDEINRGNISKIFGELITLIEEDKRDNYEVTLPYSKEKFKIPSNLYIIATMNSTDKSIATIDIALRRRFTFLKMKPNIELVPEIAKELFKKLNEHIEKTINEDYKLGHSYFMKIQNEEDLEFVKKYKVQPLLEEYFYDDEKNYKEAITILGLEDE